MQNIGTQNLPFFINISSVSNFKKDITISCHLFSTYCNIFLHNLRDDYGTIAEFSKYFYRGKPLWRIHSIHGTLFINMNIMFELLNILNTRALLPDVKATIFHQFTFLPREIRLQIINNIISDEKTLCIKQYIKELFQNQYIKDYDYLCFMNEDLFINNHPFLYEKLSLQIRFKK